MNKRTIVRDIIIIVALATFAALMLYGLKESVAGPQQTSSYAIEVHFADGSKMGMLITAPSGQTPYLRDGCLEMRYHATIACYVAWFDLIREVKIKD